MVSLFPVIADLMRRGRRYLRFQTSRVKASGRKGKEGGARTIELDVAASGVKDWVRTLSYIPVAVAVAQQGV